MRRVATVVILLLVVLFGAYTALWFFIADRIADEIAQWATGERERKLDVSWETLRVGGYPLAYRIEASGVRFRDLVPGRVVEVRVPLVQASAPPWNFRSWKIDVPSGLTAIAGPADASHARLSVQTLAGDVAVDAERDIAISLDLQHPVFETRVGDANGGGANGRVAAREAAISVTVPREPPRTHTEPALTLAVEAYDLKLPQVPAPLRGAMEEVAFDLTVLGPVPNLAPRQAAAAWRDAGGTIEIEKMAARMGDLAVAGSGTFALDRDMQPEAAFSGSVQGYDRLIAGLSAAGVIPLGGSVLARLGLSLMAKPGAEGQPEIKTSFTIQNGEMSLGPLKLGHAPRIGWE